MNEEIADLFLNRSQQSVNLAVANIENKPDEAAEALHLERVSGTPAVAIEPDLELVKNQQKARFAAAIVRDNPYINDYVSSHPLASKVSNDDYANLDQISQTARKFSERSILGAAVEGWNEGFKPEKLREEYQQLLEMHESPWWKAFTHTVGFTGVMGRTGMEMFSGAVHAIAGATGETARQLGMDESWANRLTRDVKIGLDVAMSGQAGLHLHPKVKAEFDKISQAAKAAKPYLEVGREPPVGIDPTIDKYHVEQSKLDLKNFDELASDTDKAFTKIRSPEMFQTFLQNHRELQGQIGISGERIAELYKEKEPIIGDNLLGWVPDIAEQLRVAKETGGDVMVPLAEWLARVEPELAKELHDDIRVRPNGLTKNESTIVSEYAQLDIESLVPTTPLEAVRTQAALDPLLSRQAEGWSKQDFAKSAKLFTTERRKLGEHGDVMVPKEGWFPYEQKAIDAANTVLDQLLPQRDKFEALPARSVNVGGQNAIGAYVSYTDRIPTIAYLVNPDTAIGTVRHEAIHFLRHHGFFTKEEWQTLKDAAFYNDWMDKHNIKERYQGKSAVAMIEEAIAEEFKVWRRDPVEEGLVARIFAKLSRLSDAVKDAVTKAMGGQMAANEVFKRVESGEVGRREGTKPLDPRAFAELEEVDKQLFAKANSIGMTVPQYKKYLDLIEKRNKEDMEAQFKRAQELEKQQQTKEWKEEYKTVFDETREQILVRPDVAAARFFIEGKYGEQEFQPKPRIRTEDLTKEQQEALPRNFQSSKGYPIDEISTLFGYADPQMMVKRLVEMDELRAGKRFGDVVDGITKEAADRKMQEKFGDLKQNILDEAYEHVLSKTQMDLLHEETVALGTQAGAFETPYTKQDVLAWVNKHFSDLPITTAKMDKFIREAGKAGKEAELALLKGEAAEAFKQKQRQYLAFALGNEAKKLEKDLRRFEKTAERFSKRQVQGISQEYTDFAQTLLKMVGSPVRRSVDELSAALVSHGHSSFREFLNTKAGEGRWELPVAEAIQDGRAKPLDQMNVTEFREFKDVIDSLAHVGKAEKQIQLAERTLDFDEWKKEAIDQLKLRPIRETDDFGREKTNPFYAVDAPLTRIEELMKDFDFRKEQGPFFEAIIRQGADSKAKSFDLLTHLADQMKKIKGFTEEWQKTLGRDVPQDFIYDVRNETNFKLTRWNMVRMMLNMGTESNLETMARGIATAPLGGRIATKIEVAEARARIEQLVAKEAHPEDWKYVQAMWKLWEPLREDGDLLYRRLSGVPPKWIEGRAITMPDSSAIEGGYFPLIPDKSRLVGPGIRETGMKPNGILGKDFYRATTQTPFYKERTKAVYFVDIINGPENLAGRLQQTIHDISYREFVINTNKIITDPQIKDAIKKYYGVEYEKQLYPWLNRVANEFTVNELELQAINNFAATFRMNLVAAALPLNYAVQLSPSIGALNPKVLTAFNIDRKANQALVDLHSKEIRHLTYNLDRDISEQLHRVVGDHGRTLGQRYTSWQKEAVQTLMTPLTILEKEFRSATFYGEFMEQKSQGKSDAAAAALADSMVRERHGTAAPIDLSALAANKNEFVRAATIFMGYFNTQRNWLRQLPHQAREGNFSEVAKIMWGTLGTAAIFNALLFTKRKQDDTLFSFLARSILSTPFSMVPYVRDLWTYNTEGHKPSNPFFSMGVQVGELIKDGVKAYQGKPVKDPVKHAVGVAGSLAGMPGAVQIGRTGDFLNDVRRGEQRPRDIVEWMRGIFQGEAKLKK